MCAIYRKIKCTRLDAVTFDFAISFCSFYCRYACTLHYQPYVIWSNSKRSACNIDNTQNQKSHDGKLRFIGRLHVEDTYTNLLSMHERPYLRQFNSPFVFCVEQKRGLGIIPASCTMTCIVTNRFEGQKFNLDQNLYGRNQKTLRNAAFYQFSLLYKATRKEKLDLRPRGYKFR